MWRVWVWFGNLFWFVPMWVRAAQGRRRTFRAPEDSPRRRALDRRWNGQFGNVEPTGVCLRGTFATRWVRVHTRGEKDAGDAIDAIQTVRGLLERIRNGDMAPIQAIVQDYGAGDGHGGWSKRTGLELWAWRRERREHTAYFWASEPTADVTRFDQLLSLAIDDVGRCIIIDEGATWALCPYDMGVDVIFRSSVDRDAFDRWVSEQPEGILPSTQFELSQVPEEYADAVDAAWQRVARDCGCVDVYYCLVSNEIECPRHSGYDVCCDRVADHIALRHVVSSEAA